MQSHCWKVTFSLTLIPYSILGTSVSATKIQADFSKESLILFLDTTHIRRLRVFRAAPIPFSFSNGYLKKAMMFQHLSLLQESEPGNNTYEQCTVHHQA